MVKHRGGYKPSPKMVQDSNNLEKWSGTDEKDIIGFDYTKTNQPFKSRRVHFRRLSKQKNNLPVGKGLKDYNSSLNNSSSSSSASAGEPGKYSLEVEEPVRKERLKKASRSSGPYQDAINHHSDCCKESKEDDHCQGHGLNHNHHHHHHRHHQRQAPIIVVPPINDESTKFNCQNCQFFSGWFCCIPLAVVAFAAVIITWLVLRNNGSEKWVTPSQEDSFYSVSTSPIVTIEKF